VRPFNLSGHPALTLPLTVGGLPAGLQLVGRTHHDEALCALARAIEGKLAATVESGHGQAGDSSARAPRGSSSQSRAER
jgi:Asp-tRNA(Asn)/Glu-tRNA(Gln) amidotransferase A subunit family amidase